MFRHRFNPGLLGAALGCALCGITACDRGEPAAESDEIVYVDQAEALAGLDAIHVNTGFAQTKAERLRVPEEIGEAVVARLRDAGLRIVSEDEFRERPGLPDLQIYPSVSGLASTAAPTTAGGPTAAPPTRGEPAAALRSEPCCLANVWMSVLEGTALDRDPEVHRLLPVWGAGTNRGCAREQADLGELVLEVVDRFLDDHRKANPGLLPARETLPSDR
ncbi:MAG: hypothetical protein HKP27_07385 [Myxococcales bacterium]|nr:hypothetical protein [Myxococcales bacterium]